MAERLRALLEHPLDPRLARAIVTLACAVTLGVAVVAVVAVLARPTAGHPAADSGLSPARVSARSSSSPSEAMPPSAHGGEGTAMRQDPQDRAGTAAHRRAAREIADHRALQHVPWRAGGVAIDLVGARGARAVLAVRAATRSAARRGWRGFLRRFDDAGTAYLPRLEAEGGPRG